VIHCSNVSPRHASVARNPEFLAFELHALVCPPEPDGNLGIGHRSQQRPLFLAPGRSLVDSKIAGLDVFQGTATSPFLDLIRGWRCMHGPTG
jgi:hypothetical protein